MSVNNLEKFEISGREWATKPERQQLAAVNATVLTLGQIDFILARRGLEDL